MNYNNLFIFLSLWFFLWLFIWNIYNGYNILFFIIISLILLWVLFLLKKWNFILIIFYIGYFIWTIFISNHHNILINNQNILSKFYWKNIEIVWKYDYLYSKDSNNTKYVFDLHNIENYNFKDVKFILTVKNNYKIKYWDIILIKAKISEINNYNNFNYKNFLLSKDVYFTVNFYNDLNILDTNWNYLIEKIYLIKNFLLTTIFSSFPKDEANFLAWILIWYREEISPKLKEAYNNTWITHLIAVSWYNITILIIFLNFFIKFLPFYFRPFIISLSIIFFVILVWNQPPVLRAWIMWIIWYLIIIFWRENNLLSTICLIWIIMLFLSPLSLNYDISFILSFLALFWILFFKDFYYKIFSKLTNKLAIKDSLVLTMSALTTTFPILFFWFWFFSIISPITNLLVWWLIPFIMFSWFLNIFVYLISEKLSFYFWYIPYFLLKFINETALFFSNLDFSTIKYDFWDFSNYFILFYLINLFFILIYYKIKKT